MVDLNHGMVDLNREESKEGDNLEDEARDS